MNRLKYYEKQSRLTIRDMKKDRDETRHQRKYIEINKIDFLLIDLSTHSKGKRNGSFIFPASVESQWENFFVMSFSFCLETEFPISRKFFNVFYKLSFCTTNKALSTGESFFKFWCTWYFQISFIFIQWCFSFIYQMRTSRFYFIRYNYRKKKRTRQSSNHVFQIRWRFHFEFWDRKYVFTKVKSIIIIIYSLRVFPQRTAVVLFNP